MKSITKKFVLAVLSLALTGAALTVGVYAWFTINNTVSVDQFTGQVQGSTGLLISLDGENWSGSLSTKAIQDVIESSDFVNFDEVTSTDGVEITLRDVSKKAPSTSYIEFDIHFAATAGIDKIHVTELLITSVAPTTFPAEVLVPNSEGEPNLFEVGASMTNHASNAARVSIFDKNVENVLVGQVFEQADGIEYDNNTLGMGEFPSETSIGNFAVYYYNLVAALPANPLTPIIKDDFNAAKSALAPTIAAGTSLEGVVVATTFKTFAQAGAGFTPPQADYVNVFTVTVRVWIEGWDQEAFNAILNGSFGVSMNFEGVTVEDED